MRNVYKLTEGAILLAIFAVITVITINIPVIGSILNMVLPLPFIMFTAKNNGKFTLAFYIAAAIVSFIVGSLMGLALMLMYGTAGVVIGELIKRNKSRAVLFLASTLTFLIGIVVFYTVLVIFIKIDPIHQFSVMLNESIKSSESMLKAMGNEKEFQLLKEQMDNAVKMLKTLLPTSLIMASIFLSFTTQLTCFPIAKRFGLNVEPWGSFRNLSLPKSLLWYFLIAMGINLLLQPAEGTYLYMAVINAIYILQMFMVLQGIAFVFQYFHKKKTPKGFSVLIAILAFVIPIVHYIIMILGITDLGLDLRKRFVDKG